MEEIQTNNPSSGVPQRENGMKRAEIISAKSACRNRIEELQRRIRYWLLEKHPIPAHIINGSLAEVVSFKDACEKSGRLYHIQNPVGETLCEEADAR